MITLKLSSPGSRRPEAVGVADREVRPREERDPLPQVGLRLGMFHPVLFAQPQTELLELDGQFVARVDDGDAVVL
jgi:hypothetical protein